jgi:RHH-type transcriptional regulator, rel operon repressor / antitoxin RelB
MLAVRLPEELEARLDRVAKATGRSKSYYVRQVLSEQIADLEDLAEAEARLADIRSGKSKTIPLSKVNADLGLDD